MMYSTPLLDTQQRRIEAFWWYFLGYYDRIPEICVSNAEQNPCVYHGRDDERLNTSRVPSPHEDIVDLVGGILALPKLWLFALLFAHHLVRESP
jgi:hypothetical protein